MINWEILPDRVQPNFNILVHEVRCPKCHTHETYTGDQIPNFCYICEETRTMPEVNT